MGLSEEYCTAAQEICSEDPPRKPWRKITMEVRSYAHSITFAIIMYYCLLLCYCSNQKKQLVLKDVVFSLRTWVIKLPQSFGSRDKTLWLLAAVELRWRGGHGGQVILWSPPAPCVTPLPLIPANSQQCWLNFQSLKLHTNETKGAHTFLVHVLFVQEQQKSICVGSTEKKIPGNCRKILVFSLKFPRQDFSYTDMTGCVSLSPGCKCYYSDFALQTNQNCFGLRSRLPICMLQHAVSVPGMKLVTCPY